MSSAHPNHLNQLDWQFEDKRFYQLLLFGAVLWLVLAIIVPALTVPEPSRQQQERLPAQLAKVMLEQRKTPPPEAVKPEPEINKPKPLEAAKMPLVPKQDIATARQQAQQTGLLALQDDLAAMRQSFSANKNQAKIKTTGQQQAAQVQRDVISHQAKQQFAQQQAVTATGDVARTKLADNGRAQLQKQQIEGLADQDAVKVQAAQQIAGNSASTASKGRSEAMIRQILEANKTSLYALYSRALRRDPLLQGKVVFELVINPDGSLTTVNIMHSELNNSPLERQLTLRLQSINFGVEPVAVTRSQWTVEFLPS